ncbi:MAG: anthranilate synthase component I family protein [Eubacteriales bacterium]|nr:anthranilate synthase component I family protein [Eubacteriales bacterium]
MLKPDTTQIQKLAQEGYSLIPIAREVYADVATPITLLRRIAERSDRYYLLESVEGGEKWARYSFLGFDPRLRIYAREGRVTTECGGQEQTVETAQPFEEVRKLLKRYRSPRIADLPPFTGGLVGYFAYAVQSYAEPTLHLSQGENHDFDLMLFDKVIAYDHLRQKIIVIVNMETDNCLENYGRAVEEIAGLVQMIRDDRPLQTPRKKPLKVDFTCSVSEQEYRDMVERTKRYIYDGDIFQAVISRQFSAPFTESLIDSYRVLRTTNPSPYMVYLKIDETELMCSSPETLVRLQDGRLTTFPVAGSRPRGATEEEDEALREDLLADEKELAEHNMLVDLGRNDLGKISRYHSVEVSKYQMIHRYSRIMHLCSQVEGDILPERDALDAIAAVLPAGTLSGAPKIRASEIIEEIENVPRGIYGGALGYIDFTGNMDTCIAIRMAEKKNGRVYVQAGGGIVADSVPEREYEESANKAAAVINAIRRSREVEE